MAAAKGNKYSVGNNGGKNLQDRKLASKVRSLALKQMERYLSKPNLNPELYEAILLKLAGTVLPRLSEVSGDDGGPIIVEVAAQISNKNNLNVN